MAWMSLPSIALIGVACSAESCSKDVQDEFENSTVDARVISIVPRDIHNLPISCPGIVHPAKSPCLEASATLYLMPLEPTTIA